MRRSQGPGQCAGVSGAGTDHLAVEDAKSIDDVIRAYEEQIAAVEKAGGRIILMASRALASSAAGADDYAGSMTACCRRSASAVIIHWLGDMFDPALAGYWGTMISTRRWIRAVAIISANAGQGRRRRRFRCSTSSARSTCAAGSIRACKMYTGDDFNYAELIAGDDQGFSHALLGIFDAIAPAASYALSRLAAATRPVSTTCSGRRCRCRATSSGRRRGSTRPASCSWRISTATRIISPWSAARRARARRCIWPSCFGWPTSPGCSPTPELATRRGKAVLATRGIEA